ncbi:heavy-metal-associated domain-containing protein [Sphingomonas xanthus]|nr:heavy-metal-associated domain-containing protein [Sphingomonas xanthus]
MEITVRGMSCGPCARAVTNAVHSVDPNAEVEIDLETKRVAINTIAKLPQLTVAIEKAGYLVEAS